jgi:hypothetical protein
MPFFIGSLPGILSMMAAAPRAGQSATAGADRRSPCLALAHDKC